jgi:hypothetical protein
MIIKLAVLIGLITTLNLSEVLFEKVFIARPWKFLFVSSDELITEWRVRWSHDCYSFVFGMCFALIFAILKRLNLIEDMENVFNYSQSGVNGNASNGSGNSPSSPTGSTSSNGHVVNGDLIGHHTLIDASSGGGGGAGGIEQMEFSDNRRKGKSILNIKIKFLMVLVALGGLVSYFLFAVLCSSRETCDNLTPYLNIIPVRTLTNAFYWQCNLLCLIA